MKKGEIVTLFKEDFIDSISCELELKDLKVEHFDIPEEDIRSAQMIRYVTPGKVRVLKDRYD
ncbi:MAG: hypothetical protein M0Q13_12300 [Methanothrix sp.]|jgi:hypothetical protein|nr:hypothetical protein [Methanothrix sp.]